MIRRTQEDERKRADPAALQDGVASPPHQGLRRPDNDVRSRDALKQTDLDDLGLSGASRSRGSAGLRTGVALAGLSRAPSSGGRARPRMELCLIFAGSNGVLPWFHEQGGKFMRKFIIGATARRIHTLNARGDRRRRRFRVDPRAGPACRHPPRGGDGGAHRTRSTP